MAFRKLFILPRSNNKNIAQSAYRMTNYFKNTVNGVFENNIHEIHDLDQNDSDYHKEVYENIFNLKTKYKNVCFGGDQSISIGSTLASINKNPNTGVIWIDSKNDNNNSEIISENALSYILGNQKFNWTNNLNHLDSNNLYYWGLLDSDNENLIKNSNDINNFLNKYDNYHVSIDMNSIELYEDDKEFYSNNKQFSTNKNSININDLSFFIRRLAYNKNKKYSIDVTEYIPDTGINDYYDYIFRWNMLKYVLSSINTN